MRKPEGRRPLGNRRIIFKWIFRNRMGAWAIMSWLSVARSVCTCIYGNEFSGSIECGEIFYCLKTVGFSITTLVPGVI